MADASTSPLGAFTEQVAHRAVTSACQQVGISVDSAELIRMGSNAVFRIDAETIARVAPSTGHRANAQKQIDVARWLDAIDYPATRAAAVPQPVEAEGRIATFWKSVSPETVYAPIRDVAALIRRLHALSVPASLVLPELCPFGSESDPLPEFVGLPSRDAHYLRRRIEWARSAFLSLPYELPAGVIHGDANVGNVLVDTTGQAVLIDLDSFSTGPREWDLVQTSLFFDRLGWHSAEEYRAFVDTYGYDIMDWSGYSALSDMREIAMTSWLSKKADTSDAAAAEARKRIETVRTGRSRRDWGAY